MDSEEKKKARRDYYNQYKRSPEYIANRQDRIIKQREYIRKLRQQYPKYYKDRAKQQYQKKIQFQGGLTKTKGEFILSFS